MPTKLIPISGATNEDKIETICKLMMIGSSVEIAVIKALYAPNNGHVCFLPIEDRNSYCLKNKIDPSTFTVSLSRLIKKGVVMKTGITFILHPAFQDINQCDSIKIQFNEK